MRLHIKDLARMRMKVSGDRSRDKKKWQFGADRGGNDDSGMRDGKSFQWFQTEQFQEVLLD